MSKIQLLESYSCAGMTGHVQPGVYDIDDPALHGRAKFLLEHRKAVLLGGDDPPSSTVADMIIEASAKEIETWADKTIAEFKSWVETNNPEAMQLERLHAIETAGKSRTRLLQWLAEKWRIANELEESQAGE